MALSSLPTELVEHIAAYLDLESFRSLRLACSSFLHQAFHTFKERFFRSRTLKWTKEDLGRFVTIVSNEIFGSALQHLIIDATPRHSISLWQLRKRISEADAIFSDFNGVSFKSELQDQYNCDTKQAQDLTTFFNETRYDQKCLQTAFERLPGLDSIVFGYAGMNKTYGKFGGRYCESSQHEMSRPFVSTLAAIAASKIRVKTISIHHVNHYGAVSVGRLESLAPSLRHFDAAFETLEVIKLNLRDWRIPETGFELENIRTPFVVRFLAKARNVKTLHLSCYSGLDDDLFGEMARHCKFSRLEICHMSLFRMDSASDAAEFFQSSTSTLKEISLDHFLLRDRGSSWKQVLYHLVEPEGNFRNLRMLSFSNMFTINGMRLMRDGHPEPHRLQLNCKSIEDWRTKGLDLLEQFGRGVSGPGRRLAAVAYPFFDILT